MDDTGSATVTYTGTDVAEGVIYAYRVNARNSDGVGPQSNAAQLQYRPHGDWPSGPPGSPRAPTNLRGTQVDDRTELRGIELTWGTGSEVTGYQILRRRP